MKNGYKIHDVSSASAERKSILEEVQAHYQFVPNALAALAESPEAVQAYLALDGLVQRNSLTEEQRHTVFLTLTREYGCGYCVAAHTAFAQMGGMDGENIQRLRAKQPLGDQTLDALGRFTEKLVQTGCDVSEQEIQEFLAHGYTRRHILDIITMMANKLIAVYANRIMGTDLDEALAPARWEQAG